MHKFYRAFPCLPAGKRGSFLSSVFAEKIPRFWADLLIFGEMRGKTGCNPLSKLPVFSIFGNLFAVSDEAVKFCATGRIIPADGAVKPGFRRSVPRKFRKTGASGR